MTRLPYAKAVEVAAIRVLPGDYLDTKTAGQTFRKVISTKIHEATKNFAARIEITTESPVRGSYVSEYTDLYPVRVIPQEAL